MIFSSPIQIDSWYDDSNIVFIIVITSVGQLDTGPIDDLDQSILLNKAPYCSTVCIFVGMLKGSTLSPSWNEVLGDTG